MDATAREQVWRRAGHRCEYCQLPQSAAPIARFQIEHIVPKQHGGDDAAANLALACPRCNAYKGANLTAIDPETHRIVRLYDPRKQSWDQHFQRQGATILGRTAIGRATVRLLDMNAPERVQVRTELLQRGEL